MIVDIEAVVAEVAADLEPLCTVAETAQALRLSKRQVFRLLASQQLDDVRHRPTMGSPVLIPRASIVAYLQRRMGI